MAAIFFMLIYRNLLSRNLVLSSLSRRELSGSFVGVHVIVFSNVTYKHCRPVCFLLFCPPACFHTQFLLCNHDKWRVYFSKLGIKFRSNHRRLNVTCVSWHRGKKKTAPEFRFLLKPFFGPMEREKIRAVCKVNREQLSWRIRYGRIIAWLETMCDVCYS